MIYVTKILPQKNMYIEGHPSFCIYIGTCSFSQSSLQMNIGRFRFQKLQQVLKVIIKSVQTLLWVRRTSTRAKLSKVSNGIDANVVSIFSSSAACKYLPRHHRIKLCSIKITDLTDGRHEVSGTMEKYNASRHDMMIMITTYYSVGLASANSENCRKE